MADSRRNIKLRLIEENVARFGRHIYVVAGGPSPRYAYTIGMWKTHGAELALAGASWFSAQDVGVIINTVADALDSDERLERQIQQIVSVHGLGTFSLRSVDESWVQTLLIGALDYHGEQCIPAIQIVPNENRLTIDVPDLGVPIAPLVEPPWQWVLGAPWKHPVPEDSVAMTNLDALRGERITEAARWEPDQWELFAGSGPDVKPDEARAVPLGTLVSVDESLLPVLDLPVGGAIWRQSASDSEWQRWASSNQNEAETE